MSPLIPLARVSFEIEDAQIKTFRSLSAIMCLAVTLVVSLGQRLSRRDAAQDDGRGSRAQSRA